MVTGKKRPGAPPWVLVGLLAGLLFGCGAREGAVGFAERAPESPARRMSAEMAPQASEMAKEAASPASVLPASGSPPQAREERKRIYSGFCRLLVDQVEETQRELARFAEENGGYVESSDEAVIVLRVPAARFAELFQGVLDMGEVLYQSQETLDVSDRFRDQETRLRVARSARQRLYALLERTDDVEERLAILREIKRLSEEIERIRLSLELLERQVAFSRIAVELLPRLPAGQAGRADIPFRWIAALDPVYGSLPRLKGRVTLPLGEDFAVLSRRGAFRAETPEGTRVRVGSLANQPRGDELFWQNALVHHLGPYYREAERREAGPFRVVVFASKDREPYGYLVGVLVHGRELYVLEALLPDAGARQRRLQEILRAMEDVEVRWWLP